MPVRRLAPTFFRYPPQSPSPTPRLELARRQPRPPSPWRYRAGGGLVKRQHVPLRHAPPNADEAARLYAHHAGAECALERDLNHRVFEVMAAGVHPGDLW